MQLSQYRLSLMLWALMVFRKRRCKLMTFLSFLWNRSRYFVFSHFLLWSSMTSACRVVPRRLRKSAVALSGFLRSWLFFFRKWRCERFPLNSLGFLCCSWSLLGFCLCVRLCTGPWGVATEVSGGRFLGWGLVLWASSTQLFLWVQRSNNGIMTCDKSISWTL